MHTNTLDTFSIYYIVCFVWHMFGYSSGLYIRLCNLVFCQMWNIWFLDICCTVSRRPIWRQQKNDIRKIKQQRRTDMGSLIVTMMKIMMTWWCSFTIFYPHANYSECGINRTLTNTKWLIFFWFLGKLVLILREFYIKRNHSIHLSRFSNFDI